MQPPCIKEQPLAGLSTFISATCPELVREWGRRRKKRPAPSMSDTSKRSRSMRLK